MNFIDLITNGYFNDWFFDVFLTEISLAIKNNAALLLILLISFQKIAEITENKLDDKISSWLMKKFTQIKNKK